MKINVKKQNIGLKGEITIPSDKSISHRAIMFSSVAQGNCVIKNFSSGADCHSTLKLFKNLGVNIQFIDDKSYDAKIVGVSERKDIAIVSVSKKNIDSETLKQIKNGPKAVY